VACDVVWAEVGAHFSSPDSFHRAMAELGVVFDPCDESCADLAAEAWRLYRRRGGSRLHLIPDFLVAAHALSRADRLLTRDRGFASRYFGALKIVEPGA
jgi:predicted nucleic acid-binding protein